MAQRRSIGNSFVVNTVEDGQNAIRIDLSNEADIIACTSDGKVRFARTISTTATIYDGASPVTSGVTVTQVTLNVQRNGSPVNISSPATYGSNGAAFSFAFQKNDVISAVSIPVTIQLTYNGVAYSTTLTITRTDATAVYQLLPSASSIAFKYNGSAYTPEYFYISCGYTKDNGDGIAKYGQTGNLIDGKYKLAYRSLNTSGNPVLGDNPPNQYGWLFISNDSALPITKDAATTRSAIQFALTTATAVADIADANIVDIESVPVVADGIDGADGDDGNDGADGVTYFIQSDVNSVTIPAGQTSTSITNASFTAYKRVGDANATTYQCYFAIFRRKVDNQDYSLVRAYSNKIVFAQVTISNIVAENESIVVCIYDSYSTTHSGYLAELVIPVWNIAEDGADGVSMQPNIIDGTGFVINFDKWSKNSGTSVGNGGVLGQKMVSCLNNSSNTKDVIWQDVYDSSHNIYTIRTNTWYTLSFYVKGTGTITGRTLTSIVYGTIDGDAETYVNTNVQGKKDGVDASIGSDAAFAVSLTNDWVRHSITFKTVSSFAYSESANCFVLFRMAARYSSSSSYTVYISCPKLEESESASGWCLSENDKIGKDGGTAIVADLSDQMGVLPASNIGTVTSGEKTLTTTANLYKGSQDITSSITGITLYIGGEEIGTSYGTDSSKPNYNFKKSVTPSTGAITIYVKGGTLFTGRQSKIITIDIDATVDGVSISRNVEYTIGVLPSAIDGTSPTVRSLVPEKDKISFARDVNGNLTPENQTLTISVKAQTGNSAPTTTKYTSSMNTGTPPTIVIRYSTDHAITTYKESGTIEKRWGVGGNNTGDIASTYWTDETGTLRIPSSVSYSRIYVSLFYYSGSYILIDQETIPIIKDGAKGADGADGADGEDGKDGENAAQAFAIPSQIPVPCNNNGNVTSAISQSVTFSMNVGNQAASNISVNTESYPQGVTVSGSGATRTIAITSGTSSSSLQSGVLFTVNGSYGGKNYSAIVTVALIPAIRGANGNDGNDGQDGEDGADGKQGKMGRMYYYAQEWENLNVPYEVSDAEAPYFLYNGNYYVFNPEQTGIYTMSAMGAPYTTTGGGINYGDGWEMMHTEFKYIISKAIFSDFAELGSAIFSGDFMFSKNGKIGDVFYNDGDKYAEKPAYKYFNGQEKYSRPTTQQSITASTSWSGGNYILKTEFSANQQVCIRIKITASYNCYVRITNNSGSVQSFEGSQNDTSWSSADSNGYLVTSGNYRYIRFTPLSTQNYVLQVKSGYSSQLTISAEYSFLAFKPNWWVDLLTGKMVGACGNFVVSPNGSVEMNNAQITGSLMYKRVNTVNMTFQTSNDIDALCHDSVTGMLLFDTLVICGAYKSAATLNILLPPASYCVGATFDIHNVTANSNSYSSAPTNIRIQIPSGFDNPTYIENNSFCTNRFYVPFLLGQLIGTAVEISLTNDYTRKKLSFISALCPKYYSSQTTDTYVWMLVEALE